jgi:hypothetical protein
MKTVYSSGDRVQVGLRRSVLDAAGIPCTLRNRYGPLDWFHADTAMSLGPVELCVVRDEDFDEALRLLAIPG